MLFVLLQLIARSEYKSTQNLQPHTLVLVYSS